MEDGHNRSQDQIGLILKRILESLRGPLEAGVDGRRHAHLALSLFQRRNRVAKGHIRGQIEGKRYRRILALMSHGKGRAPVFVVGDGGERLVARLGALVVAGW